MTEDPMLISRAIVVWSANERKWWPPDPGDETLLVEEFGADETARLLPILQMLKKEFFASNAWTTAANDIEMADVAAEEFRQRHPEITEEAVQGLANWYTWSYR